MSITWYLTAFNTYARFQGRAARPEFWSFLLGTVLVCILTAAVEAQVLQGPGRYKPVLVWFVALAHVVPFYAVAARRLHDTDRTGWLSLLNAIPFGTLVVFVLASQSGTPGPNQYGPDPLGRPSTNPATAPQPAGHARGEAGPIFPEPPPGTLDVLAGSASRQTLTAPRPRLPDAAAPMTTMSIVAAPMAPAAVPPPARDLIGELERLGQLKASGVLSEAEFAALKARALGEVTQA